MNDSQDDQNDQLKLDFGKTGLYSLIAVGVCEMEFTNIN